MTTLAERGVGILRQAGVALDPGLDEGEMAAAEHRYGIAFGDDHRALLSLAVPTDEGWVDWRHGDEAAIRRQLAWPLDGVVWELLNSEVWPGSWGPRPAVDDAELEVHAREHLARWHPLVPLYKHRYLPAAPAPVGSPVFSVWQLDVSLYGADLVNYLTHELHPAARHARPEPKYKYSPWSELSRDTQGSDL